MLEAEARGSLALRALPSEQEQAGEEHKSPPCEEWAGLPHPERSEMQCGVLWNVHMPEAGGTTIHSYFDQKTKGDNPQANGWEFFNMQWSSKRCANQPCFDGWDTTTEKWASLMGKVRLHPKPKLIVNFYNGYPGLGLGFMQQALSPLQAQLEAKGCVLKITSTLREPTAHAVALALSHGIALSANSSEVQRRKIIHFAEQWSNHQTKYLLLNKQLWPSVLHTNNATLDAALLPSAQQLLTRFALVGRAEHLPEFVGAINQVLGWPSGWSLADLRDARRDVDVTAANLTDTDTRAIRATVKADSTLYQSFCTTRPEASAFFVQEALPVLGQAVAGYESAELGLLLFS